MFEVTNDTFFITGFPGFIANRLLERLAKVQSRFILLVQPSLVERAKNELPKIANAAGRTIDDFQLVEGDVSQPDLALSEADLELVRQETTRIFHLAAIYDLAVPRELAMRVNVDGMRNLNELVR